MKRYIDLSTLELRRQITAQVVSIETVPNKRGQTVSVAVQFHRDAVIQELDPAGSQLALTGILGLKALGNYLSTQFVVSSGNPVKTGTGTSTVYTFTVLLLSVALDALLQSNDFIDLSAEIQWTITDSSVDPAIVTPAKTSNLMTWRVNNDVNRGGETVLAYPSTAVVLDLDQVTRLTGGVFPTDLDAQPFAAYAIGTKAKVVTDLGGGVLGESTWQKRTGAEPATDLGNGFIRCVDGSRLYRVAG
jgi:hypothetical protein